MPVIANLKQPDRRHSIITLKTNPQQQEKFATIRWARNEVYGAKNGDFFPNFEFLCRHLPIPTHSARWDIFLSGSAMTRQGKARTRATPRSTHIREEAT